MSEQTERLKKKIEAIKKENKDLKDANKKMIATMNHMKRTFTAYPPNRWYTEYLKEANAEIERQYSEAQMHIKILLKRAARCDYFIRDYVDKHENKHDITT